MTETFRDIIDLFPDRDLLVKHWDRKAPTPYRITSESVNMWRHRDGIPSWSWAALEAAAAELEQTGVTMKRLAKADIEARKQRAATRAEQARAS